MEKGTTRGDTVLIKYGNLSERMGNKNDNHHLYLVAMLYQHEGSRLRTVDDKRARGRNRPGRVKKHRPLERRRQFDCDSGARQALGVLTSWEVLVSAEKTEFNLHYLDPILTEWSRIWTTSRK